MQAVKGIYENGVIHPLHALDIKGKKKVIITILDDADFTEADEEDQEKDLKAAIQCQFSALEEDWEAPGMEKYDNM